MAERAEQRLVEELVAQPADEGLRKGVLLRFARCDVVSLNFSRHQRRTAMLVSSVPLSETHIVGQPRTAMTASSSRTTRKPDSEVSAMSARHSRVKSSTIVRIRKRRPSLNASDAKSRLQR